MPPQANQIGGKLLGEVNKLIIGKQFTKRAIKRPIPAKNWERESYRWHEAQTKETIDAVAERSFIVPPRLALSTGIYPNINV